MTTLTHLECSLCGRKFEAGKIQGVCECGGPLLARYDLESARRGWSREWLGNAQTNMWRYTPLLPVADLGSVISLGEGLTPLERARRLGAALGAESVWIKNDGVNPTGTSKAREFSCAITMAVELRHPEGDDRLSRERRRRAGRLRRRSRDRSLRVSAA